MKIAFLQDTVNQNIGLMYISAIVKSQGYECALFINSLEEDLVQAVSHFRPDIVGFSVITGSHNWALNTARRVKEAVPRALVIFGGPHPTYFPDIVNDPAVDVVARGEAEVSFPDFVNRISEGKDYSDISGLWVKKGVNVFRNDIQRLVEDLSSLPYPDHSLYLKYNFFRNQTEVPFSTTRGCPYRCSFCYNHVKAALYRGKGRYVRTRKVDEIIGEMKEAVKLYRNMRSIILYDDIIGIDKKWLSDFSDAYSGEVGLPWFTSIRADLVDEFIADKLAKANCFCLSLGLESGDESLREEVLGKKILDMQYVKAAELLHNAGIKVRTSNMFFLPGEDISKALKTVDLNRRIKADFAWAYTLQPYPGTVIYDYSVKNGYLSGSFQFDDIDPLGLLEPIINLRDGKKILVLHRLFHYAVHYRPVRKLMKLFLLIPPNPLFDWLYYLSLILSYAKYHQVSIARAFKIAWDNYRGTKKNYRCAHQVAD